MTYHHSTRLHLASLALAVLLTATAAVAQSPSIPGIVGGVQIDVPVVCDDTCTDNGSQFPSASLVELTSESGDFEITLPLNGLLNYVFYYTADGDFITGGEYDLTYLTLDERFALQAFRNGPGIAVEFFGEATYVSPFPQYLATAAVFRTNFDPGNKQELNPGGGGPLGISGTVRDGGGPVRGATVVLLVDGTQEFVYAVKTNQNGFYSFYYDPDDVTAPSSTTRAGKGFIRPGSYRVVAFVPGKGRKTSPQIAYSPSTAGAPTNSRGPLPGYFVTNARAVGNDFCFAPQGFTCPVIGTRPGDAPPLVEAPARPDAAASDTRGEASDTRGEAAARTGEQVSFGLAAAYPNPSRSGITVDFGLEQSGDVDLALFDLLGRRVATLAEGAYEAGAHQAAARLGELATGTYLLRLASNGATSERRITLVE